MNIFLIGFMGSGKTSLGKRIAGALNLPFIDSDKEISKYHQLSIAEIFKNKGETYFRNSEKNWLENIDFENTVVSLGGGTPCFANNLELIKEKGLVVYLEMSPKVLANRIVNSKSSRPILDDFKNDLSALEEKIMLMLTERDKFYKQADIVFEATNMSKTKFDLLINMIHHKMIFLN